MDRLGAGSLLCWFSCRIWIGLGLNYIMGLNINQHPDRNSYRVPIDTKRVSVITSHTEAITPGCARLSNMYPPPISPKPTNWQSSASPSPGPYIVFTTPRYKSSQDLAREAESDAKLEKFHESINKGRIDEAKFKKLLICIE